MWRCQKCGEELEDSFDTCWNCGASKDGVEDPTFQHADDPPVPKDGVEDPTFQHADDPPVPKELVGFDPPQIAQIDAAAYWLGIAGRLGIMFGILACFGIIVLRVDLLIGGIIEVIIGMWTVRAAGALRSVAQRSGNDIEQLVIAVTNLKNVFRLQIILMLIGLVVEFVAIVIAGGLLSG